MIKFLIDPDNWMDSFGASGGCKKIIELMVKIEPLATKLLLDEEYSESLFVRDVMNLASSDEEEAYLLFIAGRKIEAFKAIEEEAIKVYGFIKSGERKSDLMSAIFGR